MGRKKKTPKPAPAHSSEAAGSPWKLAVFAGLLTFLLYLPSLWSGFVYDAEAQIQADNYIHDRSHFVEVLTLRVMSRDVLDNNRPVQLLSLMTDSLFWGRNPLGYHLTNNLLHSVNVALVFLLIVMALRDAGAWKREPGYLGAAFLGALLFGFHPINVEPVAEVSSREDVLVAFFTLIGLFCATRFGREGKWWAFAAAVAACFLAVGTKESGVVAPVIIACYWLLFRRGDDWRRWLLLVATSLLLAGLFIAARFALQPPDSMVFVHPPPRLGGSFVATLEIQPRIWAFLLSSVFWPLHLSADYGPQNLAWLGEIKAAFILLAFLLVQGLLSWKSRLAALGALIFWLGLGPASNLLPMYRPIADRYMYLPTLGLALTMAGGLSLLAARRHWYRPAQIIGTMLLLGLGIQTWQRESVFANSLNLWKDTLWKSPFSSTAANNFGYALFRHGEYTNALKAFDACLRLRDGQKADSWCGAALVYEKLGDKLKAEDALNQAIGLDSSYAHPDRLLKSMQSTPEDAAVISQILARLPAQP
ncbi:tetratricopeptide repeat protein [soil metagenome]